MAEKKFDEDIIKNKIRVIKNASKTSIVAPYIDN